MMDPALSFKPHRRRLLGLAYRMLGSIAARQAQTPDAGVSTALKRTLAERAHTEQVGADGAAGVPGKIVRAIALQPES
jgi:hypothetical protein